MLNKTFHLNSTFKSETIEDGSVMVRGMASTHDFDRAGDSILADAWTKGGLGNFEKNPIILFNHDYSKPIGRATKVTPTADGLHMEAKISKHAECADLIKDGVLGAFSVGFKVKDADYLEETDGLQIKDAELFEVSVVSIPCNQAATFSLAKSFESKEAYEDFKKTFKSEEDSSSMEIDMSEEVTTPEIDLDAFAKKVAEETAAKIAIRQAEEKAAAQAEAQAAQEEAEQKAAEEAEVAEKVETSIRTGIETGTEKLMADIQKEFESQKEIDIQEIHAKYEAELKEKSEELEAMRNSKRTFADRQGGEVSLESKAEELLDAKILGVVTRKGWDTQYAQDLIEKNAGVNALTGNTIALDTIVSTQFERELQNELKIAQFFREIPVTSTKTVLPLMPDSVAATFNSGIPSGTANNAANLNDLTNGTAATGGNFDLTQKVLTTGRMTSVTYVDNDVEENTLVALLPMMREAMVRAHARAVDSMALCGNGGSAGAVARDGILNVNGTQIVPGTLSGGATAADDVLRNDDILTMRAGMGKYGLNPADLALAVSFTAYNDLLADPEFHDISEVGSELATKLTGVVGSMFAIPIVVSDIQSANSTGLSNDRAPSSGTVPCAVLFNHRNYVIPRLKGAQIESEYQVGNQRQAIVASQSLGFEMLFAGDASNLTVGVSAKAVRYQ